MRRLVWSGALRSRLVARLANELDVLFIQAKTLLNFASLQSSLS